MQPDYKTRDIYLASYLVMSGIALSSLEKDGKRFSFIFKGDEKIKLLTDDFYNRKVRVEPMEYSIAMKQVKSQMYNFS